MSTHRNLYYCFTGTACFVSIKQYIPCNNYGSVIMKNPQFSFDVFLSHNSKDKPQVQRLAERLRTAGLRVWFDEWIIQPGDDIYLTIIHGLDASRTLILCISPNALASDWVGLERSTVLFRDPSNQGRRFIPFLL